ncbi:MULTISPECIES: SAM-dependent methyltransferase [unclassified Meiothermus]|uniref:SAM-dependent methyltransferase n=1 Tax=unclassified Meiothermus TaxID=370471 RepID=UPI000D7BA7EA|nr:MULTISPECIES: SAM-dependent methyltransferase [unclassified Meiothermus]PZA08623.1 SAM-dependent methyltransferase [Meiothermus sp. Pnk-1]RYM40758.1 SAM-dependent methyltransferase [Meiothermus sp. PNK-Is4]
MKERLEKALRIALHRAHGGNEQYALFLVNNLEDDAEAPEYAARPYQGWQDAKRLINEIEALERSDGIEHVRVKRPLREAYRTGEFYA